MKRYISMHDLKASMSYEVYIALVKKWQKQEEQFELYLRDHEYNGILGVPPYWVPDQLKQLFFEARISIFDNTIDITDMPHDPKAIKMDTAPFGVRSIL